MQRLIENMHLILIVLVVATSFIGGIWGWTTGRICHTCFGAVRRTRVKIGMEYRCFGCGISYIELLPPEKPKEIHDAENL